MSASVGYASEATRLAILSAIGLSIALGLMLSTGALEPHQLITPGGRGPSAEVIAEDFGQQVIDPDATGYDGQQTYAIARDFPDFTAVAEQTDSPRYRLLRILPAVIVAPLPAGNPTVFGLLALNLVGIGLAVRAGVQILERHRGRLGMGAAAAAPLLLGVVATTTEPIAVGLALTGIERLLRSRHRDAVLFLVLAALARETMAVVAGLAALGLLCQHRAAAVRIVPFYALPGLVIGVWYLMLGELVGGALPNRSDFLGFLQIDGSAVVVSAIVFGSGSYGTWVWRDVPSLAIPALGFTAWMAFYTVDILDPLALIRVNALAMMIGVLGVGRALGPGGIRLSPSDASRLNRPPDALAWIHRPGS